MNNTNETRRQLRNQKLIGLGILALSALIIMMCLGGTTLESRDCTFTLFTIPVGLYLLLTKRLWLR